MDYSKLIKVVDGVKITASDERLQYKLGKLGLEAEFDKYNGYKTAAVSWIDSRKPLDKDRITPIMKQHGYYFDEEWDHVLWYGSMIPV